MEGFQETFKLLVWKPDRWCAHLYPIRCGSVNSFGGKKNSVFGDIECRVPSAIVQPSRWNMSLEMQTLGINQHEVIAEAYRPERVCREGESCRRWGPRLELSWRPTSREEQEELLGRKGKIGRGQRKGRHEYRCLSRNRIKGNDKVELITRSFVKDWQYLSLLIGWDNKVHHKWRPIGSWQCRERRKFLEQDAEGVRRERRACLG